MKILKEFKNIPNWITLFRFLSIPVLFYLAYYNYRFEFGVLFLLSWFSDTFDGYLARKLNQVTTFGANFDSLADNIASPFVLLYAYFLLSDIVVKYKIYLIILVSLVLFVTLITMLKRNKAGLHLLSQKATVGLTGITFLWFLWFDFNKYLFWSFIFVSYFSNIEALMVIFLKKDADEHTKSLFF